MQGQKKPQVEQKTNSKKQTKNSHKPIRSSSVQSEFKKRYFEYYDDIKISDRQDW